MKSTIAVLLLTTMLAPAMAEEKSKTWTGTWNNRKYGTRGPLKCVATPGKDGEWKAEFTGKFQGDPFKYSVTFQSKAGRGGLQNLSGTATIRGHKYQWTGAMKGNQLAGKYRSSVGYFGEFLLSEPKAPRRRR